MFQLEAQMNINIYNDKQRVPIACRPSDGVEMAAQMSYNYFNIPQLSLFMHY